MFRGSPAYTAYRFIDKISTIETLGFLQKLIYYNSLYASNPKIFSMSVYHGLTTTMGSQRLLFLNHCKYLVVQQKSSDKYIRYNNKWHC